MSERTEEWILVFQVKGDGPPRLLQGRKAHKRSLEVGKLPAYVLDWAFSDEEGKLMGIPYGMLRGEELPEEVIRLHRASGKVWLTVEITPP